MLAKHIFDKGHCIVISTLTTQKSVDKKETKIDLNI